MGPKTRVAIERTIKLLGLVEKPVSFKEIQDNCKGFASRTTCWIAIRKVIGQEIKKDKSLRKGVEASYYLAEREKEMKDWSMRQKSKASAKNKIQGESDDMKSKRMHTDEIKKHVIQPWLEWLPQINESEISFPKNIGPIENKILFDDFKHHILPEFGNPFLKYEKYIGVLREFFSEREQIHKYIIENILEKQIQSPPSHYTSYEERISKGMEKEVGDDIRADNAFYKKKGNFAYDPDEVADSIVEILDWWQSDDFDEKQFDYMYRTPISRIEDKDDRYEYHCCLDFDEPFAYIEKSSWQGTKKDLLAYMDKIIMTILNEVKTSDYLKSEILKFQHSKEQLKSIIRDMETTLSKYSHFQGILPGNCEYCP